jgi:phosphatidylglycerophosphatase A
MKNTAALVATGFGVGFSPIAPGTFGSMLGVLLAFFTLGQALWIKLLVLALVTAIGIWASELVGRQWGHDHPRIVVDEIAGQYLTLLVAPGWIWFGWGFLFFRLADMTKPYPASVLDRKKGGFFTMADDLMAGLYALVALFALIEIRGYFS